MTWSENSSSTLHNERGKPIQNLTRVESLGPKGQSVVRWFSYKELVAFKVDGNPKVVHQNDWSVTTGKHLTYIDGGDKDAKKARVTDMVFQQLLNDQLGATATVGETATRRPNYMARNLCS